MSTSEPKEREKVLVTGAAHGVGALICREVERQGLCALGIDWEEQRVHASPTPNVTLGDLSDQILIERALKGIHHVIHADADRRPRVGYEQLAERNLDLPRMLFQAAAASGAKTFLTLSSARICASTGRYQTEESTVEASNAYEQTLCDSEILLRGLANRLTHGPRLIILRTAAVYGQSLPPAGAPWLAIPPILSLFFDLVPGFSGGPRTHWVHALDVARAAIHLIRQERGQHIETFHLADDTPLSMGEFVNQLIEAYGYGLGVKIPFPPPQLLLAALSIADKDRILKALDNVLIRLWQSVRESYDLVPGFEPALSPESLTTALKDSVIANDRVKETGFTLVYPDVRLGLREILHDCQERQLLPDPRPNPRHRKMRRHRYWASLKEKHYGHYRMTGGEGKTGRAELMSSMRSPETRLPLRNGLWDLDGVLTLENFATEVAVEGTVEISFLRLRKIVYQLGLTADDGQRYRLTGEKALGRKGLVGRLTRLPFTICDARGRKVIDGEMAWDLSRDLVEFARNIQIKRVVESAQNLVQLKDQ